MIELSENEKILALRKYIEERKKDKYSDSHLIGILHKAQHLYGYLPREIMEEIAYQMEIPAAKIWGVATFYQYFNLKPVGKHCLAVCMGTACYVKGAYKLIERIQEDLNINVGDTTKDRLFTLQEARCLGACGQAPVVMIDNRIYGKLTADEMSKILRDLKSKDSN